jgi:hypothetical protein
LIISGRGVSSQGNQKLRVGILLAFPEILLKVWTVSEKDIVGSVGLGSHRIAGPLVNRPCPTGIGCVSLSHKSICLSRERVDESYRNNINRIVVTVVAETLLIAAGTLSKSALSIHTSSPKHTQYTTVFPFPFGSYSAVEEAIRAKAAVAAAKDFVENIM